MIEVIELTNSEKWDEIVTGFDNYDAFYLNAYVKAFAKEENVEPLLLYYVNGEEHGINVVMKRDIAKDKNFTGKIPENKYFDLITPYGYGGFLCDVGFSQNLHEEYEKYCRENGYICEFVRFQLFYGYEKQYGGQVESRTHNIVRSLQMPLDEMLMDFEHKVRKNIKKAERNNLKILVEQNTDHLEDFLRIYYGTMQRTEANDNFFFKKDFFETISEMKDNIAYFYVLSQEKVISAELVIYGAENAYSYLGGTDSEYFDLRPNDFLKFEIIKWLKEKRLKNFVLGGGYGTDDGIFRYKKSFAPDGVVDFYIGRNIFDKEKYQELVDMRKQEENFDIASGFFPLYRA